jgi:hypothetical protein
VLSAVRDPRAVPAAKHDDVATGEGACGVTRKQRFDGHGTVHCSACNRYRPGDEFGWPPSLKGRPTAYCHGCQRVLDRLRWRGERAPTSAVVERFIVLLRETAHLPPGKEPAYRRRLPHPELDALLERCRPKVLAFPVRSRWKDAA